MPPSGDDCITTGSGSGIIATEAHPSRPVGRKQRKNDSSRLSGSSTKTRRNVSNRSEREDGISECSTRRLQEKVAPVRRVQRSGRATTERRTASNCFPGSRDSSRTFAENRSPSSRVGRVWCSRNFKGVSIQAARPFVRTPRGSRRGPRAGEQQDVSGRQPPDGTGARSSLERIEGFLETPGNLTRRFQVDGAGPAPANSPSPLPQPAPHRRE